MYLFDSYDLVLNNNYDYSVVTKTFYSDHKYNEMWFISKLNLKGGKLFCEITQVILLF